MFRDPPNNFRSFKKIFSRNIFFISSKKILNRQKKSFTPKSSSYYICRSPKKKQSLKIKNVHDNSTKNILRTLSVFFLPSVFICIFPIVHRHSFFDRGPRWEMMSPQSGNENEFGQGGSDRRVVFYPHVLYVGFLCECVEHPTKKIHLNNLP